MHGKQFGLWVSGSLVLVEINIDGYLQCELVCLCCKQIHPSVLLLINQQLKESLRIIIIGNMFKSFRTERDTTLKNPEHIYIKIYVRS